VAASNPDPPVSVTGCRSSGAPSSPGALPRLLVASVVVFVAAPRLVAPLDLGAVLLLPEASLPEALLEAALLACVSRPGFSLFIDPSCRRRGAMASEHAARRAVRPV
jgi:hypothetical protein